LINTIVSQLVQVDLADGSKKTLTSTPGLKVFPQFLSASSIAYHVKGGATEGLYTTDGKFRATPNSGIRSPRYSPDGATMIYEKVSFRPATKNGTPLFSFDAGWNYRYTDVFPQLSADRKQLVYTEKAVGSSIAVMNPDFTGYKRIYDPMTSGLPPDMLMKGLAGAFQPTWSPNREWVAFGVGQWFFTRGMGKATIVRIKADGSMNGKPEPLTDGSTNAGFPSYSPDGRKLVYRVYSNEAKGLRILDIESRQTTVLTTELDNVPGWSPDGTKIVFTRKLLIDPKDPNKFNYDVFTIKPDGTDLKRLTTGPSNDAHATWTWDGRIAYNSGNYGFRDELALYDNSFQPDGQNWLMNADGSNQHAITDTLWEEAMPLFIPND
jgi:Tol biopolymer transport system component